MVLEVAKTHLRVYVSEPVHITPGGNWNHIINVGHEDVVKVQSRKYFLEGKAFFLLGDAIKHIRDPIGLRQTLSIKYRGATSVTVVIKDENGKEIGTKIIQIEARK